jgi:hypothetical protein
MPKENEDTKRVQLALNQTEAAAALGVSVNTFKEHIRPYVKYVAIGDGMRFPVSELQAWLDQNARGLD